MVVTGDVTQIDLPARRAQRSARPPRRGSPAIEDVGIVELTETDVVRHPLVARDRPRLRLDARLRVA